MDSESRPDLTQLDDRALAFRYLHLKHKALAADADARARLEAPRAELPPSYKKLDRLMEHVRPIALFCAGTVTVAVGLHHTLTVLIGSTAAAVGLGAFAVTEVQDIRVRKANAQRPTISSVLEQLESDTTSRDMRAAAQEISRRGGHDVDVDAIADMLLRTAPEREASTQERAPSNLGLS